MKTLNDIRAILSKHKEQLTSQYPIRSMAIFGAYARREKSRNTHRILIMSFS